MLHGAGAAAHADTSYRVNAIIAFDVGNEAGTGRREWEMTILFRTRCAGGSCWN